MRPYCYLLVMQMRKQGFRGISYAQATVWAAPVATACRGYIMQAGSGGPAGLRGSAQRGLALSLFPLNPKTFPNERLKAAQDLSLPN